MGPRSGTAGPRLSLFNLNVIDRAPGWVTQCQIWLFDLPTHHPVSMLHHARKSTDLR